MGKVQPIGQEPRKDDQVLKAHVARLGAQAQARRQAQSPQDVKGTQNGNSQADLAKLSEEAFQQFNGNSNSNSQDFDAMLSGIEAWFSEKLDKNDQEKDGADGPGGEQQQKKKKVEVDLDFTPHRRPGQVSGPGSAVGEIKVNRREIEEPGESRPAGGGGAKGKGGRAASAAPARAGQAPRQDSNANGRAQANQNGNAQRQDPTQDEVQMSAEAAQQMQKMQQKGLPTEGGQQGVASSDGGFAPMPKDGGILRSSGVEQTIWTHPGGDVRKTGGLLEVFQKLDNSPSRPFFEERSGQDAGALAHELEQRNKQNPNDSERGAREGDIQRLRNPVPAA